MSYTKTIWENRDAANNIAGTKLNAEHMNNIENGIEALNTAVSNLTTQVTTIESGLTPEQVTLLETVQGDLATVQNALSSLKAEFDAHVHSNVVGETTGPVIVQTTP